MFCSNCGTENEDNMLHCQNCGAPLNSEEAAPVEVAVETPAENTPVAMPKTMKLDEWVTYVKSLPQKVILAGLGGILAVLLLLLIFAGGGGYKSAVNSYYKAYEKAKIEKMMNFIIPKDIQKQFFEEIEDVRDMDKEEYLEEEAEELEEELEDVEDFEWEIKQAEKLNKLDKLEDEMEKMKISDLDDFRDMMDDTFEDFDKFDSEKISDAYAIKLKLKAEVDGDKESETVIDIVYKYKGKWYLLKGTTL